MSRGGHLILYITPGGHIHKRDEYQVEPKIGSSLALTAIKFLSQLELDPFCEYQPRISNCSKLYTQQKIYSPYYRHEIVIFVQLPVFCMSNQSE